MMGTEEQRAAVLAAAQDFPATFCLRAFPGELFRVNPNTSYVNDFGVVMLYTDVWSRAGWASFAKGNVPELRGEVTAPQILEVAEMLHGKAPGSWVLTNQEVTLILELRPGTDEHPHGGIWWRTHHLLRQLGGSC